MRILAKNVFEVGTPDWGRELFDALIPLPNGTSYNAYIVKGADKTALIDTTDPAKTLDLFNNIVKAGIETIDYVIANHAEQDHSGSIPDILMMYPNAKVVTNQKCKAMLMDLLDIEDNSFLVVEDGQELSLGGKTLKFILTPWVHWPETMSTYLPEDKILFSCDFFGSHLATTDLFVENLCEVYDGAKRYFAEIMMPFRPAINNNLKKIADLDIEMIAPSHGPVYKDPASIIDAYKDWASDKVTNEVVIAYVSMHESTEKMAEYLTDALAERGIKVQLFNLLTTDTGKLAMSLVDAATLIVGSPTVLTGPHPKAAYAAMLANAIRPKTKFVSIIGSYGWATKMVDSLAQIISNMKAEILDPVIAKGQPKENDYIALEELADTILKKHKEIGIIDS